MEAKSPERDPHSANLRLADHSLLIELGTRPVFNGKTFVGVADDRLLILDTGSASTVLTDRYLAEHKDLLSGQPPETGKLAGADGAHELAGYEVRNLPLFASTSGVFMLNGQLVLAQPMHGPAEDYFGIIGQDVLSQLPGYTIDFRTMTFTVLRNAAP